MSADALFEPGSAVTLMALRDLVLLRLLTFHRSDHALYEARRTAPDLADLIAGGGDHLTAPGNFTHPEDIKLRKDVLNAVATTLALGALQPGGVEFAGLHWEVSH